MGVGRADRFFCLLVLPYHHWASQTRRSCDLCARLGASRANVVFRCGFAFGSFLILCLFSAIQLGERNFLFALFFAADETFSNKSGEIMFCGHLHSRGSGVWLAVFESGQGIGTWLWLIAAVLGTTSCLLSLKWPVIKQTGWKSFLRPQTIIWFSSAIVVVLSLWLVGYQIYYGEMLGEERETLTSPDGRYKIFVLARGVNFFAGAPGDAGGVSGNVSIVDVKSAKRIGREPLEMVQFADSCNWTTTNVTIVDVGQWQLPSGKFDAVW